MDQIHSLATRLAYSEFYKGCSEGLDVQAKGLNPFWNTTGSWDVGVTRSENRAHLLLECGIQITTSNRSVKAAQTLRDGEESWELVEFAAY